MSGTYLGLPSFPQAARVSTRDTQLRANLTHATHTIRDKRATAIAELDDWPQLRAAGAAIKDHTLRHLDTYLVQLEQAVTAAGGTVHWALDADEANRIVTDIVHTTGHTEVVKVKSMTTQETGLNEALAQAGITAYETDLAELIVQLDNDKPSHILVPAIHKNRTEIRDIFTRTMAHWGRPAPDNLTDTPTDLAEAARLHLREKFLRTKVAISGANFMIAETGTMAVLESEGNGRMCLTLPDTLITIAGIEKIIPTYQDLEVFLQTLPRSSTADA
ncbi:L-lactate dehydrogenase complex protein LldF [Streptomyces sp. DvalAA-14]|nr:L-lactate dehydrogenase complex protein LldF [Streptomyces sp. DvalAA-14]